jgi:hypothetical protein
MEGRKRELEYERKWEEGRNEQEKTEKEKKEVGVNRQKWTINPFISFTSLNAKVNYSTSNWS